jgi:hypothetical protein
MNSPTKGGRPAWTNYLATRRDVDVADGRQCLPARGVGGQSKRD